MCGIGQLGKATFMGMVSSNRGEMSIACQHVTKCSFAMLLFVMAVFVVVGFVFLATKVVTRQSC